MRILALGGAGEMGAVAARLLVDDDRVTGLVVADLDPRRAAEVAAKLGPKASARQLDVADYPALLAAVRDCDVVVNTVGPFFRFGVHILTATIDARRDYVDICDDPQPTLEMLAMNERARAAGVTALIGMGASPGIANLLAVTAGRELDSVEAVLTGWNIGAAQTEPVARHRPSAALLHAIRQISGTIPLTRGGAVVQRPALEKIRFSYPGIGPGRGRSFGHPEAVTLHRVFPELRDNTNIVVGDRATLAGLSALRHVVGRRLVSADRAARLADWAEHLIPSRPANIIRPGGMPPLFAIATGRRDYQPAAAAAALAQIPGLSMAANTGIPLAVAAPLVAASTRPGVHSPETLLDRDVFFADLSRRCIGNPPPHAMIAITRSWEPPHATAAALNTSLLTAFLLPPSAAQHR